MKRLTHVEQIESPKIRRLFLYWQSKCGADSIPLRQDIVPEDIADHLPNLLLVEFEQDPFRVKFRLAGTKVVEVTGYEFTGKYLDEIAANEDRQPFHECYEIASKSEAPIITRAAGASMKIRRATTTSVSCRWRATAGSPPWWSPSSATTGCASATPDRPAVIPRPQRRKQRIHAADKKRR